MLFLNCFDNKDFGRFRISSGDVDVVTSFEPIRKTRKRLCGVNLNASSIKTSQKYPKLLSAWTVTLKSFPLLECNHPGTFSTITKGGAESPCALSILINPQNALE